jgi:hypothetical protein
MEVLPIVLSQNKIKNKYSVGVLFVVNILLCTPQLATGVWLLCPYSIVFMNIGMLKTL